MAAESQLGLLLSELNRLGSLPLGAPDEAELADVAAAGSQLRLANGARPQLAERIAADVEGWAKVWADPLSEGQAGLDLLSAVMRRAAAQGGGRLLE